MATRDNDPYLIIAADAHAGLPTEQYREYLETKYHPQFEALYRTDEYRHHLRWVTGKQDLPLLQRYEMIEYWEESGRVDLDSSSADIQKTSFDFIQDCLAFQIARMIVNGVRLVPQSGWAPAR